MDKKASAIPLRVRDAIRRLPVSRIAEISALGMGDPAVIPLWYGEDGVTDSLAFAKEILHRAKVGLAPGSAFGPVGEGYLRLCFARDPAQIAEAVKRLRPLLDR